MKKATKTIDDVPATGDPKKDSGKKPKRRNTNSSTRGADRQRSGSNGPQQGSH